MGYYQKTYRHLFIPRKFGMRTQQQAAMTCTPETPSILS